MIKGVTGRRCRSEGAKAGGLRVRQDMLIREQKIPEIGLHEESNTHMRRARPLGVEHAHEDASRECCGFFGKARPFFFHVRVRGGTQLFPQNSPFQQRNRLQVGGFDRSQLPSSY